MKPWVERRVTELMGYEDELIINLVMSILEEPPHPDIKLCPKKMTIDLKGI
jgi:hypothetical protein